jgi:hypothetical protein
MRRGLIFVAIFALSVVSLVRAADQAQQRSPATAQSGQAVPTFTKDVAPILFKNCTGCHRPGEIAPMSLLTYEDARPYARAIFEEVRDGHMPPWHAEAAAGTFSNERRLSTDEKNTLMRWANGGAPKGSDADMPPAPTYSEGWQLGVPDQIFEMSEAYEVPASGTVQYEYFYLPTNLKEPTWVRAIEVRPGAREVVHHVLAFYRAKPDIQRAPVLRLNPEQMRIAPELMGQPGKSPRQRLDGLPGRILATYAPGTNPQVLPAGTAIRLEPGGIIELQMHYTATGKAMKDKTRVGLYLSKDPSPREVRVSQFFNAQLRLPAGEAAVAVDADLGFLTDTTIWGLFPHTHVRGTKWRYVLELPDGTKKTILDVPRYDFNWQTYYMFKEPLQIPAGSRIVSTAWYDNSAKNPANPDPKVNVLWGDQTWEEMQYTGLLFSPTAAPKAAGTGARR